MRPASAAPPAERRAVSPAFLSAAPPVRLPLAFLLPGILSLLLALSALPFVSNRLTEWFGQPQVLALVHVLTLGFGVTVLLGASVQLLPVLSGETFARPSRLGYAAALSAAGIAGMVASFWMLSFLGVVVSAGAVVAAFAIFLSVALPVLLRGRSDGPRLALLLSYAGLALTMTAGLLIGIDRHHGFLPGAPLRHLLAHLHVGLLATFGVAIFGVEPKLLSMFLVAAAPSLARQRAAVLGLFFGTLFLSFALWFGAPVAPFAVPLLAAIGLQVLNLAGVLSSRKKHEIDTGFVYALSAYADLGAAALLGILWSLGLGDGTMLALRIPWVYVFLLLVGFVVQTIVGFLSKILPFLVWQATYARNVGTAHVPTLKEMAPERLQRAGFVLFRIATLLMAVALWRGRAPELRFSAAFLAVSIVPFVLHVARATRHLWKPIALPPLEVFHAAR